MRNKVAAAALQYSKWLSRFICWIWCLYRFSILLVAAVQPSVAEAVGATIPGIDTIMMINVSTYLVNSLGEKWIYSDRFVLKWLDKGGFQSLLGRVSQKMNMSEEEEEVDENGTDQNG